MQGICAQLSGGFICLLYIHIVLYLAVSVAVCKASMLNQLCTGIQGIYGQLMGSLDLLVGVAVCASMLIDWGVHLPSIYMHCITSSSRCSGMQGIYAQLTVGVYI